MVSHNRIGDVHRTQGDLAAALESYRAAVPIAEGLALSDPSNVEWQRDLSVCHSQIGDMEVAQGDLAAALENYRVDLAITDRLAHSGAANVEWQRDLFTSLHTMTGVLLQLDEQEEACQMARRLNAQAQLLTESFPQDRRRDTYLRDARELLARACGPAA
jgi:hypothetical protein